MIAPQLSPSPLEPDFELEPASLEVVSSPACVSGLVVRLTDRVLIGRDGGATLSFEDTRLSRRHAELRREGDEFVLRDLASTNGTWVNGARCLRRTLKHGDSVRVGSTVMLFVDRRVPNDDARRLEIDGAAGCLDDNLRALQLAFAEGRLTTEQLDEVVRDCARAAVRLVTHARGEEPPQEDCTPVIKRTPVRSV